MNTRLRWAGILCMLSLLMTPVAALAARTTPGVGFAAIIIHDPVNGGTMPGYVFYPAAQPSRVTWRGPYELHATPDAKPIPGAKPLVVISHGHGGSDLGHHDLAVYLASHGFIVATLQHPKDNFIDASGDGQPDVMVGRPIQVKATISMLLDDARWKKRIDPDRIGVAGFSNGGYTSLLLVGAVPQFTRFISYCKAHPDDLNICAPARRLKAQAARHGQTLEQLMASMQNDLHRWGNTDDPRIKAAFVMAPLSLIFDQAGLASVNRPVFLYYGQNDEVLRPAYNVLHIAPLIKTLTGIRMIPKAGHYVFLSPCSPKLAKDAPEICNDPPGVHRVAVHRQIDADALAFFRKTLGSP
ncbi:MAG: alpha/beta hydrolase family protein [Rhodanobacteraceae bacterium]